MEEKQSITNNIEVHGIEVHSRHGIPREMLEMISFCMDLYKCNMQDFIESLFYDSNSNVMGFCFSDDDINSEYENEIYKIAEKHIFQFVTKDGVVKQGKTIS